MAKRFYKDVAVTEGVDGFVVNLDGRELKTPGKIPLIFDSHNHAELVAAEWRAQDKEILPDTMPCTRLMNVACEQTPGRRSELVKEFCAYVRTDLLCYRSASPRDLAERQQAGWQPVLDWAAQAYDIALATTIGIKAIEQPEQSLNHAADYANSRTNADLTLLLHFTASLGSAVLALAVMEKRLAVDTAFALSRLDEAYQNERWGTDEEAMQNSRNLLHELSLLAQLIEA